MSSYNRYKREADSLDMRLKTANNFFSLLSLTQEYQSLIREMLETIKFQEEK